MPKVLEDNEVDVVDQEPNDQVVTDEPQEEKIQITLGDPPEETEDIEPVKDNAAIRSMRERIKELNRERREREQELDKLRKIANPVQEVGNPPTLEECGYDAEKFADAKVEWTLKKKQFDAEQEKIRRAQEEQQRTWEDAQRNYATTKASLGVEDFDDSEALVDGLMNQTQRGIIISGASNPAQLIYVLGRAPEEAKRLADISDPVKFAFAVAKLEEKIKVTKKPGVRPEGRVVGTGASAVSVDRRLEELRKKAEQTGDYSEVMRYKRALKKS